jgi:hypothetical protein
VDGNTSLARLRKLCGSEEDFLFTQVVKDIREALHEPISTWTGVDRLIDVVAFQTRY